MKKTPWPEWATFKCPYCHKNHRVRLASDALNGLYDKDGNKFPGLVDFTFRPNSILDTPLVLALGADRRVMKELGTAPLSFEGNGNYWT